MLRLLIVLILLLMSACSSNTAGLPGADSTAKMPQPAEGDAKSSAGLVRVRMRPQKPVTPQFHGVSLTAPLSVEATLDSLPLPHMASAEVETLEVNAGDFVAGSLRRNVDKEGSSAVFSPGWPAGSIGSMDDLAFCTVQLHVLQFPLLSTVSLAWREGEAPSVPDNAYIGMSDYAGNRWQWFQVPDDEVISLANYSSFQAPSGRILITVALTGTESCKLDHVVFGRPEERGTGDSGLEIIDGKLIPPLYAPDLPASFDLRDGCPPINDQGPWGSCTAFAIGDACYNFELNRIYEQQGWNFGTTLNRVSPKHLYIRSGELSGFPPNPNYGRYMEDVFETLVTEGVSSEGHAPYNLVYDNNWSAAALEDASLQRISDYAQIRVNSAEGLRSVKALLALQKTIVPMRTFLDYDFIDYEPGDVWTYHGPNIGGHAMCIVGYDDLREAFLVRNSWSEDWGDEGYCWISYQTFISPFAGCGCYVLYEEYNELSAQHFTDGPPGVVPPGGLEASDGEQAEAVLLTWQELPTASGYRIYRDTLDEPVAEVGALTNWEDLNPEDQFAHTYWITALQGVIESQPSAPDTGFVTQAPLITSVSGDGGAEGQLVEFSVNAYGGGTLSYEWQFGEAAQPSVSTDPAPEVILGLAGSYLCSVSVSNAKGFDELTFQIEISENEPPDIGFYAQPQEGMTPLEVYFDASPSSDEDGEIVKYEYDWDGDLVWDYETTDIQISHVFTEVGEHSVTLRVTDDLGKTDQGTHTITVFEDPPGDNWFTYEVHGGIANFGRNAIAQVGGRPAFVYRESNSSEIRFVRSDDALGHSWPAAAETIALAAEDGYMPNLLVVNGMPAVTYSSRAGVELRYRRASSADGSAWNAYVVLGSGTNDSDSMYIAELIDCDGRPASAFLDEGDDTMWFVRAADADGAAWGSPVQVSGTEIIRDMPSLAMIAGKPALAFYDTTADKLLYSHAADASGAVWNAPVEISAMANIRYLVKLASIAGLPAIVYSEANSGDLYYRRAQAADGSSWAFARNLVNNVYAEPMYLQEVNGLPLIPYRNQARRVQAARFGDADATGDMTVETVYNLVTYEGLASGVINGRPVMAMMNEEFETIRFAVYE